MKKLGKLRLHSSGRVTLLTEDGKLYEMQPGLNNSSLQCLAAIDIPPVDPANAPHPTASPVPSTTSNKKGKKSSSSSNNAEEEGPIAVGQDGAVHFLGNVTKKLVVTPTYELGVKKNRTSANSINSSGQSGHRQEEEEIVMMEE